MNTDGLYYITLYYIILYYIILYYIILYYIILYYIILTYKTENIADTCITFLPLTALTLLAGLGVD